MDLNDKVPEALQRIVLESLPPEVEVEATRWDEFNHQWRFRLVSRGKTSVLLIRKDDWDDNLLDLVALQARFAVSSPDVTAARRRFWISFTGSVRPGGSTEYSFDLHRSLAEPPQSITVMVSGTAQAPLFARATKSKRSPVAQEMAAALWAIKDHIDKGAKETELAINYGNLNMILDRPTESDARVRQ